jgi:hypothetical protein
VKFPKLKRENPRSAKNIKSPKSGGKRTTGMQDVDRNGMRRKACLLNKERKKMRARRKNKHRYPPRNT